MGSNVILIDDSDTELPDAPSHRQSMPSESSTFWSITATPSRTASRECNELRSRTPMPVPQPRSSPSAFERKRKTHELNSHPLARRSSYALPNNSNQRHNDDDERIPVSRQSIRIIKKKVDSRVSRRLSRRRQRASSYSPSSSDDDTLLKKHRETMHKARQEEAYRKKHGQPRSRLRIPAKSDPESAHREFYVKSIEAEKIEKDIRHGYIVRVEERHAIQLDDLDPELLTGRPLTEKEAYWVSKKQARRAGPRSSSWPSIVPTHDQHTEYISLTDKARNLFDPNALECSECGSKLWGTSILFPLSRPTDFRPPTHIIDQNAPLCVGCARLFSCVNDRQEKLDMINWIVTGKTLHTKIPKHNDSLLMDVCRKRIAMMKTRARIHYSKLPDNFVTAEELFDDVKHDDYNCYLVGSPMRLEHGYFNSLTFDHIFPISIAMMKTNCWSIENFQPMSFCMNQVKGNEANKEAKRWLINFKAHYFSSNFKA
ncbi:uncharacterized protein ATC70_009081 [Mucor velutinosus]|uniref:Uncharacterized protein n=1 Tax=Mucor velutinosus TaxID=708070 RepID=A0AAN7I315_9FUNG|nr:hypothetical protein ATC70_009081 [Mucor velutinosus]